MDFVRLGERYTTDYLPEDNLIEGYNSLIWTERFGTPGEFELKTFDLSLEDYLPEDTLVSHLDTREVMQVETHDIVWVGEGDDAKEELTIKGRSASIILDHRWVESKYQKKRKMRKKYSATSAAAVLLFQAVDNTGGVDVTRGDATPDEDHTLQDGNYSWNTKDDLPNVAVTEAVASEGKARWWQLEQGPLLPQLEKILAAQDLGIRVLRPVYPTSDQVITVKTALADRGDIVRTKKDDIPQLRFEIYQGVDRSTGNNKIDFSLLQGHLVKPQYLRSYANYKTGVEVMSDVVEVKDIYRSGDGALSGWQKRTMGFDAGTPEIPTEPTKPDEPGNNATRETRVDYRKAIDTYHEKMGRWRNRRSNIISDFKDEAEDSALDELKKMRKINMFAADISTLSPWTYKVHYDLGDKVMLYGDRGKTAKMVVAEYVRTDDADGDRGFPGLVAP
jgi:Siphovirus ReqiPepy6 Gp37-like protein